MNKKDRNKYADQLRTIARNFRKIGPQKTGHTLLGLSAELMLGAADKGRLKITADERERLISIASGAVDDQIENEQFIANRAFMESLEGRWKV